MILRVHYGEEFRPRGLPTPEQVYFTHHEIAFLAGLGTHSHCKTPRLELLRRYLRSMGLRQEWGRMRRYFVLQAVLKMIQAEEEAGDHDA